jgi:hypothetical protein
MKRLVILVLLALSVNSGFAQINLSKRWSYSFWLGPVFSLTPEKRSEFIPYGFALNNKLVYMINNNIGLVPFDLTYAQWSVDKDDLIYMLALDPSINPEWLTLFDIDVSFHDIIYAPGFLVSGGSNRVKGFGQFGAGVAHQSFDFTVREPISGLKMGQDDSQNNFTIQLSGGVEASVSKTMKLSGMTRYAVIILGNNTTAQSIGFWGGLKVYF